MNKTFWRGRRVFVTGHTGFKGSWLTLWLTDAGAEVTGYALEPATTPSLYAAASVEQGIESITGDVRDKEALARALQRSNAEVVFHCAAQSLVRASYASPVETFDTNVMGTVHLLDGIRSLNTVRAAVIVTSDKCYAAHESGRAHVEEDRLGGRDPYSSSKACAELVTESYRASFFGGQSASIATVRAGNVIGGGDWAADRLVPDVIRAFTDGRPALIRHPGAVRPWQHVLEPLHGYLLLAESLSERAAVESSFNFAPAHDDTQPVSAVVDALVQKWGSTTGWRVDEGPHPPESPALRLDSSRAREQLAWWPRLHLSDALDWTVDWYRAYRSNTESARTKTMEQIHRYEALAS